MRVVTKLVDYVRQVPPMFWLAIAAAPVLLGCNGIKLADVCTLAQTQCAAVSTPTASPTAMITDGTPMPTATATAAPTATATPTSVPVTGTAVPVGGVCSGTHPNDPTFDPANLPPAYGSDVTAAIQGWIAANPTLVGENGGGVYVRRGYEDAFVFGVVARLNGTDLDAVVDANDKSQIAVALHGDTTFHEGYALLTSPQACSPQPCQSVGSSVRLPLNGNAANGYMARCHPRGFPVSTKSASGTPTSQPSPTAVVAAACPPVAQVFVSERAGSKQPCPAGLCELIDFNPLFPKNLVSNPAACSNDHGGIGCPCNLEHPSCGVALGDSCEPLPWPSWPTLDWNHTTPDTTMYVVITSDHEWDTVSGFSREGDYIGRVRGPAGTAVHIEATLMKSAPNKGGGTVDQSVLTVGKLDVVL